MKDLIIDCFAGSGGASVGIEMALKIVKEDGVEALETEYGDTCDDWWGRNE